MIPTETCPLCGAPRKGDALFYDCGTSLVHTWMPPGVECLKRAIVTLKARLDDLECHDERVGKRR